MQRGSGCQHVADRAARAVGAGARLERGRRVAAAYEPDSGYGDGAAAAGDFLARARELGAAYQPRTRVTGFRVAAGRVRAWTPSRGPIEAPDGRGGDGPWSRPLLAAAGFDAADRDRVPSGGDPEEPAWAARTRPRLHRLAHQPVLPARGPGHDAGRRLLRAPPERPRRVPAGAGGEALAEMASGIARRVPRLADAGLAHGITGVYDMSPDARPLLGELPGIAGCSWRRVSRAWASRSRRPWAS